MNGFDIFVIIVVMAMVAWSLFNKSQRKQQQAQLKFIKNYAFHDAIIKKVHQQYPHLSQQEVKTVFEALRTYFYIYHIAKGKRVAMPSLVVDTAWHEFILFTRLYAKFCQKAAGHFIHHTPTSATSSQPTQDGIRRIWQLSCEKDNIKPKKPKHLPILFNIDSTLNIENGYQYSLDKQGRHLHNGLSVLGAISTVGFSTGWQTLDESRDKSTAQGVEAGYVYYVECDGSSFGDGSSSSSDGDSSCSSCGGD